MLSDIKLLVESCQHYLKQTKTKGTQLESYLAKFLLISISAEYEKEYRRIVSTKAKKNGSNQLASFIIKKTDVRSLKIGDIKGNILNLFDENYPKEFQKRLDDSSATKYNNIIENRNLAAHGESIHMSFDEVVKTYQSAEEVLTIFSDVMNLNDVHTNCSSSESRSFL